MRAIKVVLQTVLWVCSLVVCVDVSAKTVVPVFAPVSNTSNISDASSASIGSTPNIKVMFTPNDNVQAELVRVLTGARKQILVQAYLLTDNVISDALIAAHQRGINVQVLMDAVRERDTKGSDAQRLVDAGVRVRLETAYDNAHNKIIIIDQSMVVTGSYNFTYSAQYKNAENMLFIKNAPKIVTQFIKNWHLHYANAIDFK